jgi:8-oxo-dGTP pyrophosphatase MutT (NUDIX family)
MMKRHREASSFASAHVFPGGVQDPVDVHIAAKGSGGTVAHDAALALKLCAVRETFEETGVLVVTHNLAREELQAWRAKVRASGAAFAGR